MADGIDMVQFAALISTADPNTRALLLKVASESFSVALQGGGSVHVPFQGPPDPKTPQARHATSKSPAKSPVAKAPPALPICAICQQPLQLIQKRQALECMHVFHSDCLLNYRQSSQLVSVDGTSVGKMCPFKCHSFITGTKRKEFTQMTCALPGPPAGQYANVQPSSRPGSSAAPFPPSAPFPQSRPHFRDSSDSGSSMGDGTDTQQLAANATFLSQFTFPQNPTGLSMGPPLMTANGVCLSNGPPPMTQPWQMPGSSSMGSDIVDVEALTPNP